MLQIEEKLQVTSPKHNSVHETVQHDHQRVEEKNFLVDIALPNTEAPRSLGPNSRRRHPTLPHGSRGMVVNHTLHNDLCHY